MPCIMKAGNKKKYSRAFYAVIRMLTPEHPFPTQIILSLSRCLRKQP